MALGRVHRHRHVLVEQEPQCDKPQVANRNRRSHIPQAGQQASDPGSPLRSDGTDSTLNLDQSLATIEEWTRS